jgi:hypothetical protein
VDYAKTTQFEEHALTIGRKEGGYEVEPFNLDAERESGQFDEDFNYIAVGGREEVRAGREGMRAAAARRALLRADGSGPAAR